MKSVIGNDIYYFLSRLESPTRALVDKLAGSIDAARMYETRATAESYLGHDDPKFRWAAMHVLGQHWKPDEFFRAACERLLSGDSDTNVRCVSMWYLALCYYRTNDARIGKIAAELVYDTREPNELRLQAYRALFNIRRSEENGYEKSASAGFCFPADVDWHFVDSALWETKKGQG